MISFNRLCEGFDVRLSGDRQKYYAEDIRAACAALQHHYGQCSHTVTGCPLCAACEKCPVHKE